MKSVSAILGISSFAVCALSVGGACTDARTKFDPGPPPLASDDAGAGGECKDTLHCSPDLKQVIRQRCDGTEEVTTCGPGLGCGDGACVDACTSAALSKGSIGCSFATLPPDEAGGAAGSCFAAMIANVWDRPVKLEATLGGDAIDISKSTFYAEMNGKTIEYTPVGDAIETGKVAIVLLAGADTAPVAEDGFIPCPRGKVPAVRRDPLTHKTARNKAFRLTTDTPVSAYSIWPYGGAHSATPTATVLLPTSSWGTNYLAVSTFNPSPGAPNIQIVAAEDDTVVRMRPNVDIIGGGGVEGIGAGQTQTWRLDRGEVVQITQRADTSGSPIVADKPIGLFGGSECTHMMGSACDVTQQQIAPVSEWGHSYALVPWRPRTGAGVGTTTARETVPWRFVGAADGTKLTYDPARPGGAPETLEAGQVMSFVANDIVTVRSQDAQHPFYAGMFMTGGAPISEQTRGPAIGDPDFVNVVPSEQFLDRYIFYVDHTYAESTLTFVRRKTPAGFEPVNLECAGEITDWKPLGSSEQYEFAWVYLTKGGRPQAFPGGTCGYGRHEARSDGPFAIYVWGTDAYASYGYPGGMGSRPLSDVTGPPIH